jgi:hypothetical protein
MLTDKEFFLTKVVAQIDWTTTNLKAAIASQN